MAVDRQGLVRHQLAGLCARGAEPHAIGHVVQARLQQHQQVGTRVPLAALGLGEIATELTLQHAVHALDLLLFAELQAEVRGARTAGAAVLTWLALKLGLVGDGPTGTLEKQISAFTTGEFGLGAEITCHERVLFRFCLSDAARLSGPSRASLS